MTESYRIRHGGLLRCCLESLDNQLVRTKVQPQTGTILTCEFCKKPNLVRAVDGVWEWNLAARDMAADMGKNGNG